FKPAGIGSSPLRGAGPPAVARAGEAVQAGLDRISRRWPVAGIADMAHHRERAVVNRTVIAAIAACGRPPHAAAGYEPPSPSPPPRPGARSQPREPQEPAEPRRWKALAVVSVAQFMLILDLTVVNVALPGLGTDLGLSRTAFTWVISAYGLVFGGLLLLGG